MHRFRKKSDVKRSHAPAPSQEADSPPDFLPPVSDFRTSLILPDLSRRFSLLRTASGDPVTVDDLRTKFAEQRAKGTQQTITEEEEDMLLETLSRIRARTTGTHGAEQSQESINGVDGWVGEDESGSASSHTIKLTKGTSSVTSSPSSRSTKRYSNNLFGSGRLRDYSYMKSVSRASAASSSKAYSLAPSETTPSTFGDHGSSTADGLRPLTPTDTGVDDSVQSSPSPPTEQSSARSGSATSSLLDQSIGVSASEYRLQRSISPAVLKRASLALERVIKEIEDEVEEEIVMPRSTPIPRNHVDHQDQLAIHQVQRQISEVSTRDTVSSIVVEEGMAILPDKPADANDLTHVRSGASPVPATPGYTPGMPRPMTPRGFEVLADERRSHSTTPRATSPMHNSFTLSESTSASVNISKILRRDSTSSNAGRQSPRPTTPLFLQRSMHGSMGSTSSMNGPLDDRSRSYVDTSISSINGHNSSFDPDQSLSSSILGGRRRPASPLSNPPFQAIPTGSPSYGFSISRPTTPSKIVWTVNNTDTGANRSGFPGSPSSSGIGNSRDNSWTSDSGLSDSDVQNFIAAANSGNDSDVFGSVGWEVGSLERKGTIGSGNRGNEVSSPVLQSSESHSSYEDNGRLWASNRVVGSGRPSSPMNESLSSHVSFSDATEDHDRRLQSRNHRSVTPTQGAPRSPASPTFGGFQGSSPRAVRRSSRQSPPTSASPFDLSLPSLTMNSRANMSSSSLVSTGSSFHSWEDSNDKTVNIFNEGVARPLWHDLTILSSGKTTRSGSETRKGHNNGSSNGTSPEDDWEPEEIIRSYAGLRKADFATIQEKLVAASRTAEHRGSALRKRRPSTSQSNYSTREPRVASPPPSSPINHVFPMTRDQPQQQKNGAALETHTQVLSSPGLAPSLSASSIDSGLRRNLAQVLFGDQDDMAEGSTSPLPVNAPSDPPPSSNNDRTSPDVAIGSIAENSISELLESALGHASTHSPPKVQLADAPSPYFLKRNPSTARIPQSQQDQAALAREVEQRVQAATAALRKPSNEVVHSHVLPRKRIDPSQISKPTLVSASTSVDTIPLKMPSLAASSNTGGSKIGSRFKRLRGSIRGGKAAATIDENASITSDPRTQPGGQIATYDADKLKASSGPSSSSIPESGRYKVSVPSPPASAGPGLKGFMARFRTKRMTEIPQSGSSSVHGSPQIPSAPFSPMSPSSKLFPGSPTPTAAYFSPEHAHAESDYNLSSRSEQEQLQFSLSPSSQQNVTDADFNEAGGDTDALQQLFAAANKIGLDQTALNDLLVRSGSISSRNLLTRAASTSHSGPSQRKGNATSGDSRLAVPPIQQPNLSSSTSSSDHTATPTVLSRSLSSGPSGNKPQLPYGEEARGAEDDPNRRASTKTPEPARRYRATDGGVNPVVRRTIIFMDPRQPTVDPGMQRKASTKRRRTSMQSVSNRSVHDRVPTPPPSKTPIGKRFSHDASPPVPHLPQSFGGQVDNMLTVPVANDKSHSATYDSVYELYGDSRTPSVMVDHDNRGEPHNTAESGTGVELIEFASGETIWKIVNGLRDDDDESMYTGRNSISSEYSNGTREGGEGMQVFVKEHIRGGSKGSLASMISRKKGSGGKPRPETKILYSSPERVANLIEQLSQGMDAASFNFMPYHGSGSGSASGTRSSVEAGHSTTSSLSANEITWKMNEIDHMLTSMVTSTRS